MLLIASCTQVSQRESKDGNDAKLEASKTFSRVIAAGLHRVASAMAKDGECISKASKVTSQLQCAIQPPPCRNLPEGAECEHAFQPEFCCLQLCGNLSHAALHSHRSAVFCLRVRLQSALQTGLMRFSAALSCTMQQDIAQLVPVLYNCL